MTLEGPKWPDFGSHSAGRNAVGGALFKSLETFETPCGMRRSKDVNPQWQRLRICCVHYSGLRPTRDLDLPRGRDGNCGGNATRGMTVFSFFTTASSTAFPWPGEIGIEHHPRRGGVSCLTLRERERERERERDWTAREQSRHETRTIHSWVGVRRRLLIHDRPLSLAMERGEECFDCEARLCYSERDIPRSRWLCVCVGVYVWEGCASRVIC